MSRLQILMLFAILAISTVKPNLNAIEPVEQRVKREQLGCCIKKLWESSKEVWENEESCSPREFVVRPSCHYDITYDAKREMFSYESYASNRTDTHCYFGPNFYGCLADYPTDRKHANKASFAIKQFRSSTYNLGRIHGAPKTAWNCLFYAGNDDKPTCHNISNAEAIRNTSRCIYIYDLVTQKLRFANRTCEGAQQLVSWSNDKDGCVRHNNSVEYTCVGDGKFRNYKEIIDNEKGCCVYKNKEWESSASVWESEYYGCTAPGDFQARSGCFYSIDYDTKREMLSLTSINGPGSVDFGWECRIVANQLICKEKPRSRAKVTPAATWFKFIRQRYMNLVPSAPQSDFYCLYYAGNDDKPTCHNITHADEIKARAKCVYVYDPITQKFGFANRTCEGAQQLVTWPSNKDGCFRYQDSWEYTCVLGGQGRVEYTKNIENSKLPLKQVGCCKRAKFGSSNGCDAEAFMRVQPESNIQCHFVTQYHDEKQDSIEEVSYLAIYIQEGLGSDTTCSPVPESPTLYHCQCPIDSIEESHAHTQYIHALTKTTSRHVEMVQIDLEDQYRCCVLHNLSTNDISQWKQECHDNLDRKLTASKPNSSCHYILEKNSDTEPIRVLAMFQKYKDQAETTASCSPIKESANHYHCQCPSSKIYSKPVEGCLKGIFDVMKDAKVEPSPSCNQITTQKPQEVKPPKFCCDYTNILSTQISLMPRECGSESWKQVESNADCHYVLEKKSSSKHAKVLLLIFNGVQVESGISCKPIENAVGLYHCNCPAASDQSTKECLWGMFNMVGDLQKNSSGALH